MARIRSIHPGLFTDEAFMSASPMARLLMIGLWTEAWDDGVFEWKPIVIKARIFPADACDADALLCELASLGSIKRVERGGKFYGLIRNFRKFQRPKKPNNSGISSEVDTEFLGPEHTSSDPVPNQFRTSSENPPQMEDGGCSKENTPTSFHSVGVPKGAPEPAKRGTRLPADWSPNMADPVVASADAALVSAELAKFRDYWASQPGAKGVKLDWQGTFRNWLRRAIEDRKSRAPPPRQPQRNAFFALAAEIEAINEPDHHPGPTLDLHASKPADVGDRDFSDAGSVPAFRFN